MAGSEARPSARKYGGRTWLGLAFVLLVRAWVMLKLPDFSARAELASAYAAHAGCACHFIESRPVDSCGGDLEAAAWMVSIDVDEAARTATASVPLLASRTAHFRKDWGCQLAPVGE